AHASLRTAETVGGLLRTRRNYIHPRSPAGETLAVVATSPNAYKNQLSIWLEPSRVHDTDPKMAAHYNEHRVDTHVKDRLVASLRRYIGSWVAIKGPEVLITTNSLREVIDFLRNHNLRAESVFRVPADPRRETAG